MPLQPLDFDPFAGEARLQPLDFDPFEGGATGTDALRNMSVEDMKAMSPDISVDTPTPPDTTLAGSIAKAVPRGATETLGTTIKGAGAVAYPTAYQEDLGVLDQIEAARKAGNVDEANRLVQSTRVGESLQKQNYYANPEWAIQETRKFLTETPAAVGMDVPLQETPLMRAGAAVQEFAKETFPIPPEHESNLAVQVAQGVGSTGTYVAARMIPGIGQVALPLTAMAAGAGEAVENAIQHGAPDAEAARAAVLGMVPGSTDVAPIDNLFKGLGPKPVGLVYAIIRKALEQAVIEGGQEGAQQVMQNMITRAYDATQSLGQDVLSSMSIGAIVGVLFGGVSGGGTTPKPAGEREKAPTPELSPADRASPIPDDLIAGGRAAMADAEAAKSADEILTRNQLPGTGTRVRVEYGDGRIATGIVADAFAEANAELGIAGDGIKVNLDNGTRLEEYVDTLAQTGTRIVPEEVTDDRQAQGRLPRGQREGQEPGRPVQEPEPSRETSQTGRVLSEPVALEGRPGVAPVEGEAARPAERVTERPPDVGQMAGEEVTPSEEYPFSAFREALPKDADGAPDFEGVGNGIIERVAPGKAWRDMTPDQRRAAMDLVQEPAQEVSPKPVSEQVIAKPKAGRKGPVDVITFLADEGGIRDDEGHALKKQRNLQRFVPKAGPLIRKDGMSIDQAGEKLWQAGYFGPVATTERPTVAEVLDLIEQGHKVKTYTPEGQVQAIATEQERTAAERNAETEADIKEYGRIIGEIFSKSDISAVLSIMTDRNVDAEVAVEAYNEHLAIAAADAMAEEAQDGEYRTYEETELAANEGAPAEGAARPEGISPDQGEGAPRAPPAEPDRGAQERVTPPEPTTEKVETVEGPRDQYVMPGTEVTERDRLRARGKQPLRGGNAPMDVGMFGTEVGQADLVERARQTEKAPEVSGENATISEPAAEPSVDLANKLASMIIRSKEMSNKDLFAAADEAFDGTVAEGRYSPKDAYDALELAVNKVVARRPEYFDPRADAARAHKIVERLQRILDRLPSQTRRTVEQESFQQFSTPPHYAYAVNWVGNIGANDVVLEPSAGVGGIAVFAKVAGPEAVYVNELSDRRAALLRDLDFTEVFTENADHLNAVLPKQVKPTLVVMNPPFSQTAGRMKGKKVLETGATHIEQALKRLEPDGRLVAIVGRGMGFDNARFRDWWDRIGKEYNVRANISVGRPAFKKYGTSFETRLLVIDKTAPTGQPLAGHAETIPDLIGLLEDVRNDRVPAREQRPSLPSREGAAGEDQGRLAGAGQAVPPATDVVGSVERGTGTEPGREPGTAGVGPAEETAAGGAELAAVPGANEAAPDTGTESAEGTEPRGRRKGAARPAGRQAGGNERVEPTKASETDRGIELERVALENTGELSDEVYEQYRPSRVRVAGAQTHPTELVESAAMASVLPPAADYVPQLPENAIKKGLLSDAQLEGVIYAGQAHEKHIPDGPRMGYFIGDGTGVGKGREIAGIILDNWNQGRRKHLWVSKNKKLIEDAQRDLADVGDLGNSVIDISKTKLGMPIGAKEGVLFVTYDTLKTGAEGRRKAKTEGKTAKRARIDQILEWLGDDFDGALIFDEAHLMGNAVAIRGKRGLKKPAQRAIAGVDLQNEVPEARVVYASATGATDIVNLAYAERLGLWGKGTPFNDKTEFINEIDKGGVAAMELVARDLKALGLYTARNLSFRGVEQERLTHTLTPDQRAMYDEHAKAWQLVLGNVNDAMEEAGSKKNGQARSSALSAFWGAHQRFFNSVLTSMQMPSVISGMEKDLNDGNAVVMQLVNTNEAAQERAVADIDDAEDLTTLDMSPMTVLLQYVERAFPVVQFEEYVDENGNERTRPVVDSGGEVVLNPESVARRDELLTRLGAMRAPDPPLEQILRHFGTEKVAEVTGRQRRFIRQEDGTLKAERRGDRANRADISAFMGDKKQILVFSEAGGTGASYHADRKAKNQRRRMHYLLQAGWRADNAVQGFGRSHRSNQVTPPLFKLVETDLKGHKRFIATIARRLDQLGALTKGERHTGGQGMFTEADNLESSYADNAIERLFTDLHRGRVEDMSLAQIQEEMGLNVQDPNTGALLSEKLPSVSQFLNRLLSLTIDRQNAVFDEFYARFLNSMEVARHMGTLDVGTETIRAESITKTSEQTAFTDERSGAETKYVKFRERHKINYLSFEKAAAPGNGFYRNLRSGRIWARGSQYSETGSTGIVTDKVTLRGPNPDSVQTPALYDLEDPKKWEKLDDAQAEALWNEEIAKGPEYRERDIHMITGAILPIWDRLKGKPRIFRLATDEGERFLGRVIRDADVSTVLKNLGLTAERPNLTPQQAVDRVVEDGYRLELANNWKIRRSLVNGEQRIEIDGPDYKDLQAMQDEGVLVERIQYKSRFFIPTGAEGAKVMEEVTKYRPIVEAIAPQGEQYSRRRGLRPDFVENADAVIADLEQRLKKVGISDRVSVRLVEKIRSMADGRASERDGRYLNGLIDIALTAPDKAWTMDHEIIHALRDLGLFRAAEWRTLETSARADRPRLAEIRQRYADLNLTEEQLIEEAVADTFADWREGRQVKGFVRTALERIRAFFKALGEALRGSGYRTTEDIFGAIERGTVGHRDAKGRFTSTPAVDQPGPMGISPELMRSGEISPNLTESQMTVGPKYSLSRATTFDKPESEARWQEARKGVAGQETMAVRVGAWLQHLADGFARHYVHLPNEARFSDVREQLRKLEAAPQASKEQTLRVLRRLTDGMSEADLDLFTRKVVLDDLTWESDQEHELPFDMTPEDVTRELAKVDRLLDGRPDLAAKIRERKLIVRSIADQMVAAGVLHREQVRNPAYYRHQVLDYARAQVNWAKGPGKKVKAPRWARRMGSMRDINANLLEAEFEWMQKALTDIATAKTITWIKDSEHNVRGQVIEAARNHNEEQVKKAIEKTPDLQQELDSFKQRIAIGLSKVRGALRGIDVPAEFEAAAENIRDPETADDTSIFPLLSWMLDNDMPGAAGAGMTFKAIAARKAWMRDLLGKDYVDPMDIETAARRFAPEGYVTWQPEEGRILFTARTLPEHVMDRMIRRIADERSGPVTGGEMLAAMESVRSLMAIGGPKFQLVIPSEIADTLNGFRDDHADGLVTYALEKPLGMWKRWVLINPRRVLKYNLNNMSGDLDAVIAGNPRAVRRMPGAIRELYAVMKGAAPSSRYREAVERGVFDSGLSIQEIPDINFLSEFEDLIAKKSVGRKFLLSPLAKVWRTLHKYTQFRENWLRYASYLDYVERLEAGESMEKVGYGAAKPELVDAIQDPKDKAALLARELVGDYGAISHWGRGIRRKYIPFWSWLEINTKRYWRLGANAWGQGVGKGFATAGITGAVLGTRMTAYLAFRAAMLYGLVQLWNNLFFGDEEDELSELDRTRLHLNLGRSDDGEIRLIRFQGALSDFMSWLGFEDAVAMISDVEKGRADWTDVAKEVAKAPVNKLGQGITPIVKVPVEMMTGYSFFPDVFEPIPVRDGWRNLFRTFSIENEYDIVFGRPTRGYLRSLEGAVTYRRDVGENAYNRIRSIAWQWNRREKGTEGSSNVSTPRSEALYNWRLAKKFGDSAAERKYRAELRNLGVAGKDLATSIKRAHPLGGIAIKDRARFLRTLTPQERRLLDSANTWYRETFLGG